MLPGIQVLKLLPDPEKSYLTQKAIGNHAQPVIQERELENRDPL